MIVEAEKKVHPIDRREAADAWLHAKLGDRMRAAIEIMIEYHQRGGRRTISGAGLRVFTYDKIADRERQRERRRKKVLTVPI